MEHWNVKSGDWAQRKKKERIGSSGVHEKL